eukprot:8602779-Pyramimonas_sp.AAC.1
MVELVEEDERPDIRTIGPVDGALVAVDDGLGAWHVVQAAGEDLDDRVPCLAQGALLGANIKW